MGTPTRRGRAAREARSEAARRTLTPGGAGPRARRQPAPSDGARVAVGGGRPQLRGGRNLDGEALPLRLFDLDERRGRQAFGLAPGPPLVQGLVLELDPTDVEQHDQREQHHLDHEQGDEPDDERRRQRYALGQQHAERTGHGAPEAVGDALAAAPPASGRGVAAGGAGRLFAFGPSWVYGRIVFSWSIERIWPQAGMKITPLAPGSGMEPSIKTERSSLSGTSSSGLRSPGTDLSAVSGLGAPSCPTCP